jgi:hypothetical protein
MVPAATPPSTPDLYLTLELGQIDIEEGKEEPYHKKGYYL